MKEEIIIAGFGGQGILFLGKLLCKAGMYSGLHVTYLPSYGAEVRGGTAHCHVIISDDQIALPVVSRPSVLIVMNEPSLIKFEKRIIDKGLLILNSSLIDDEVKKKDIDILSIPATGTAHEVGNVKVANMVILGAYIAHRNIVSKDLIIRELRNLLLPKKESLIEVNERAFMAGYNYLSCKSS